MASGFRHPTTEDYDDPDPRRGGRFSRVASIITDRVSGFFAAIGSLLFFGLILLLWAADISSCFRATSSVDRGPVPRGPRADNASDKKLIGRLTDLWTASGGMPNQLDLWLLDDRSVNAASVGGGRFILWTGLETLTDEQLDAVIAHELAHDRLQHSRKSAELRDVTDFVGEAIGALGRRDEATTRTLKKWSGNFIVPRYDRAQELQADANAVEILGRRYSDPATIVCRAFVQLRSNVGEAGGGFFDSHPALTERIEALRKGFPSAAAQTACR